MHETTNLKNFQNSYSQIYSRPKNINYICFATHTVPVPNYHPSQSHRFGAHDRILIKLAKV